MILREKGNLTAAIIGFERFRAGQFGIRHYCTVGLNSKEANNEELAEGVMAKLIPHIGGSGDWTAGVPLPGGDFPVSQVQPMINQLQVDFPFLSEAWATRLIKGYGVDARAILGEATTSSERGQDFGATLSEAEVRWLMEKEYACTADDIIWRRSKLGLRLTKDQVEALEAYCAAA